MKLNFQPKIYMDPAVTGAVIGGGSSLLGDIFNLFGQSKANREQEAYNTSVMQQQRQWAVQDINNQNAYNSPAQQMARYKEAGLNPNLIYGEGVTASSGNADMPRSVPSPSFSPSNEASSFSNLGSQANSAVQTYNDLKNSATSRNNTEADTSNKIKYGVFQDIKNIEEKSNGKADPAMTKWYQEIEQNMKGFESKKLNNEQRSSEVDTLQKSLDYNIIQDKNTRDWAQNTRAEAMQKPTLALAIQSVANSLEQNVGLKQSNQNAAAEFQHIMESTHVQQIEAMLKNKELNQSDAQKLMGSVIDMIILSKALKK